MTGPIARGDINTVRHHVELLSEGTESASAAELPADIRTAYLVMARATAQRAVDRGIITEAQAAELLDLLG